MVELRDHITKVAEERARDTPIRGVSASGEVVESQKHATPQAVAESFKHANPMNVEVSSQAASNCWTEASEAPESERIARVSNTTEADDSPAICEIHPKIQKRRSRVKERSTRAQPNATRSPGLLPLLPSSSAGVASETKEWLYPPSVVKNTNNVKIFNHTSSHPGDPSFCHETDVDKYPNPPSTSEAYSQSAFRNRARYMLANDFRPRLASGYGDHHVDSTACYRDHHTESKYNPFNQLQGTDPLSMIHLSQNEYLLDACRKLDGQSPAFRGAEKLPGIAAPVNPLPPASDRLPTRESLRHVASNVGDALIWNQNVVWKAGKQAPTCASFIASPSQLTNDVEDAAHLLEYQPSKPTKRDTRRIKRSFKVQSPGEEIAGPPSKRHRFNTPRFDDVYESTDDGKDLERPQASYATDLEDLDYLDSPLPGSSRSFVSSSDTRDPSPCSSCLNLDDSSSPKPAMNETPLNNGQYTNSVERAKQLDASKRAESFNYGIVNDTRDAIHENDSRSMSSATVTEVKALPKSRNCNHSTSHDYEGHEDSESYESTYEEEYGNCTADNLDASMEFGLEDSTGVWEDRKGLKNHRGYAVDSDISVSPKSRQDGIGENGASHTVAQRPVANPTETNSVSKASKRFGRIRPPDKFSECDPSLIHYGTRGVGTPIRLLTEPVYNLRAPTHRLPGMHLSFQRSKQINPPTSVRLASTARAGIPSDCTCTANGASSLPGPRDPTRNDCKGNPSLLPPGIPMPYGAGINSAQDTQRAYLRASGAVVPTPLISFPDVAKTRGVRLTEHHKRQQHEDTSAAEIEAQHVAEAINRKQERLGAWKREKERKEADRAAAMWQTLRTK